MRYIYSQCHFAKEQHERRDAVKRQFVPVVSGGNPAAGGGNGLHGNRQLQLGFKCPQGASIKYVSADFADKQSYGSADKGGGGQKIRKFCGRTLWKPPYGDNRSENDVMRNYRYVKIMSRCAISRVSEQKGCELGQLCYFGTNVNPLRFPTRLLQDSKSSFSPFFGLEKLPYMKSV